jgi:hypothetical protein
VKTGNNTEPKSDQQASIGHLEQSV